MGVIVLLRRAMRNDHNLGQSMARPKNLLLKTSKLERRCQLLSSDSKTSTNSGLRVRLYGCLDRVSGTATLELEVGRSFLPHALLGHSLSKRAEC